MKNPPVVPPKIIGFAAYSGTGKTTLLKQVIPILTSQKIRIAIIKHSHHDFEIDKPGKDSYELHHAGASQTLISSKYRSALIAENLLQNEPELNEELNKLDLASLDLVLVEGFRHDKSLTRIELHRASLNNPLLFPQDELIIAIASDEKLDSHLPQLDINNPLDVAHFIVNWMKG